MGKKRLLWIGDAGVPSGFARVTHAILDTLKDVYDVTVLGINYRGDPNPYPYPMYVAAAGGDYMGVGRLIWMCDFVTPDVIVIQNDGWNIPQYVQRLRDKNDDGSLKYPDHAKIPIVAIVPVDGKNFYGKWLDGVALAVFWTQFALDEARAGGYNGPAVVIPLGIDLKTFYPEPKDEARAQHGLEMLPPHAFIVGSVNRNQPRKRVDLLIRYFALWVQQHHVEDAFLYLHIAPTGDQDTIKTTHLMRYYGVLPRLISREPPIWYGDSDTIMRRGYNCLDVAATTTQGEGFGLTALEAMACGIPVIAPDWSALGDWGKRGAWLIPCTSTIIGPPWVNVIGGIADEKQFIAALHRLYMDKGRRAHNAQAALECAQQTQFRWPLIGKRYIEALAGVTETKKEVVA